MRFIWFICSEPKSIDVNSKKIQQIICIWKNQSFEFGFPWIKMIDWWIESLFLVDLYFDIVYQLSVFAVAKQNYELN